MRFIKTRTILGELREGDYISYDPYTLPDEIKAICPDAICSEMDEGDQISFTVICPDEYETAMRELVQAHGSQSQVNARRLKKEATENNASIKVTLSDLDAKSIRSLREQTIATAVAVNELKDTMTVAELVKWLKDNLAIESWKEGGKTVTVELYNEAAKTERGKLK